MSARRLVPGTEIEYEEALLLGRVDPVADGVDGRGRVVEQADDGGDALDAFQQAQDHLAFDDQDVAGLPNTAPSTTIAEPEP